MAKILAFLADHCGFLFQSNRFRFTDSRAESALGDAVVVLESKILRLRITYDRAELLLDFQPLHGKKIDWYSLGLLRGVLRGDRGGSEVLDPAWAQFLNESLDSLEQALSDPARADDIVRQLKDQARQRAKALFG